MSVGLSRYQTAAVLLVLGCVFLLLAFWSTHNEPPPSQHLATLHREAGEIDWRSAAGQAKTGLKLDQDIRVGDSVETNEIGEARLDFDSGAQVRILPGSVLSFAIENHSEAQKESQQVLLLIEHGDILVLKNGSENLFVSKSGERISAKDYNESDLRQRILTVRQGSDDKPEDKLASQAHLALSEAEITNTLSGHKREFFKCYTKLLQKEPDLRGEATLNFSILPSGKVEDSEAVSQWNHAPKENPAQEDFNRCLHDVLARIEFRPFQGSKIATIFPLRFE